MAIKCTQCGAALTDSDSKFCKYCGAKLPEEPKEDKKRREFRFEFNSEGSVRKAEIKKEQEAQRMQYALEMQRRQEEARKRNNKMILILIGVAIFFFLFAFLASKR